MNSWKTPFKALLTLVIASLIIYQFLEEVNPLQKYSISGEGSKKQDMVPRTRNDWSKDCIIPNTTYVESSRYTSCLRRLDMSEKMDCDTLCQETIQTYRKANMRRACTNNASESLHPSMGLWDDNGKLQLQQLRRLDHLFAIENSQVIYCSIPKVATTAWRLLLLIAMGEIDRESYHDGALIHALFRKNARTLASFNITEAERRLKTYKKFFFVRDPLERMLSLFLDKAVKEKYWRFNDTQYEQFLQFVNKEPIQLVYRTAAEHYALGAHLCFPCDVSYDFIGRTETSKRDAQYIFDHFIKENRDRLMMYRVEGHPTNSSDSHKKDKYYQQVSNDVLMNFTDKFLLDYVLFNYDKPKV